MANGDEAAIAMLEEELGYLDGEDLEGDLAMEESQVAEDARTQAAIEKDRESRPGALEQFLYGEQGKAGRRPHLDFKLGERPLGPTAATQSATQGATQKDAGLDLDTGAWRTEPNEELTAKVKESEDKYLSGINRQIWMQGQIANKLGQIGEKQAELLGLTADYGTGEQETLAEAKLRIQKKWQENRQKYQARFDENMEEAQLMAQYPGATMDQIKLWKRQIEFDPHRVGFSPEAAKDMLRRKATAMRNLARASEINPNRAYGGVTSQILAGLAVSMGAWASSKSGRPNTALELYKFAIANDIDAQKENFRHKRGAPARARGEYAFWMNRYNDDRVATLGTAVAQYGAAANSIQKEIAQLKGGIQKDQALAIQGQLMSQKNKIQAALAKAAMEAEQRQFAGFNDFAGNPVRYTGPADVDVKARNAVTETARKSHIAIGALEQYREAWKKAGLALKPSDKRAALDAALQALVARLGDVWDKGVLQEFEWKQLNDMLPGSSYPALEKMGADRVDAVLDQLAKSFRGALTSHVGSLTHYHMPEASFKGDAIGTGAQGSVTRSGRSADQQRVLDKRQAKALAALGGVRMVNDPANWKTRKERGIK